MLRLTMSKFRYVRENAIFILVLALMLLSPIILRMLLNTSIPLAAVESSSMVPTLNIGDVVVIVGVKPEDIKPGDIIVFDKVVYSLKKGYVRKLRTPIVHRVVNVIIKNGVKYFRTKGDANPLPDQWYVPEDAILGKVLCINGEPFRIPYVGYFSILFHNIIGG
ncbi:MAG: signal peptidase I [Desulfurococcales archaeon ex4484_217_1]|nr:MAG: signal peptidase I [Desulfurococcales archaeon ex4484_217_1]